MGLLAVWYTDFFGAQTVAVLPYDQYLKRFPAYLQQLTMESNGKHVTLDGAARRLRDRPDLLGRAGHQRPALLLPADPPGHAADPVRLHRLLQTLNPLGDHHDLLMANVFAQTEALAFGKTPEQVRAEGTPGELVPHRDLRGQPAVEHDPRRAADAAARSAARRALRAQRLHPGRDLGHRLVRPVGRRARQGAGEADRPRAPGARRARAGPRQLDERADPALPRRAPRAGGASRPGSSSGSRASRARSRAG